MMPTDGVGSRIWDALTDLYTYVLVLDAEWRQLGQHLAALASNGSASPERPKLERRHHEITEELDALRGAIAMLRAHADAAGNHPSRPDEITPPSSSPAT